VKKLELQFPNAKVDVVDICKRRVALHVLKTSRPVDLSNETIATAFGWTLNELLDFWREDVPKIVRKK